MWYYRACRKFTKDKAGKKYPFYCVVEYLPKIPNYGYNKKTKELTKRKGHKNLWSIQPEWPSGNSKKELIECLEMMIVDVKRYRPLTEKRPWNPPPIGPSR